MSKKKVGRPTVMTEEVLGYLRQAYLWDATDKEASAYAGIARSTLSEYKARNKEFSDRVRAWKLNPILLARKKVVEELSKNAKVAMWYLERKKKDEFSLRYEQKVTTNEDVNIVLDRQETNYDLLGQQARAYLAEKAGKLKRQ